MWIYIVNNLKQNCAWKSSARTYFDALLNRTTNCVCLVITLFMQKTTLGWKKLLSTLHRGRKYQYIAKKKFMIWSVCKFLYCYFSIWSNESFAWQPFLRKSCLFKGFFFRKCDSIFKYPILQKRIFQKTILNFTVIGWKFKF